MQSIQYLIDDILAALNSPVTADPAYMTDTAALYAEACAEVNERMRRIGALLDRGLRSEAIQLAEEEPHILDVYQLLDFPEYAAWESLLDEWGMALPPPLDSDTAERIDLAYAAQQPVEALLKRHRLLALGRAPLAARIKVLRSLIDAEQDAASWEADLLELEQTRLKQVEGEARSAAKRDDVEALMALVAELGSKGWRASVPSGLSGSVEALRRQAAARHARRELDALDPALNEAHMAFDVENGVKLEKQWRAAVAIAELADDDPILDRVQPALDWVRQSVDQRQRLQDRDMAVIALEQALDDNATVETLTKLYLDAEVYDEPIPDVVRRRYEDRLAAEEVSSKRKHRLILASVFAAVVLLGGAAAYVLVEQLQHRRIVNAIESLKSLNDTANYNEAVVKYQSFVDESPEIAEVAEVQAQHAFALEALGKEKTRYDSFVIAMETAEAWSAGDVLDTVALDSARSLARTPEEKRRLRAFEDRLESYWSRIAAAQTTEVINAFKECRVEFTAVRETKITDEGACAELIARLNKIQHDVQLAVDKHPRAAAKVLAQAAPLTKEIGARIASIALSQKRILAAKEVTGKVGDLASFRKALNEYYLTRESAPGAAEAGVLVESDLWEGLLEWDAFLHRSFQGQHNLTPQEARRVIAEGDELIKDFPSLPYREGFEQLRAYLLSVSNRHPEGGDRLLADLEKKFRADPLVIKLFMVRNGEDYYYCREAPVEANGLIKIKHIVDLQFNEKEVTLKLAADHDVGRAPQSIFAEQALPRLRRVPQMGWEPAFVPMIEALIERPRMDPVVKALLLQAMLEPAMEGSTILHEAYKETFAEVQAAGVGGAIWVDPEDPVLRQDRTNAEIAFNGLKRVTPERRGKLIKAARELMQAPSIRHEWVGWLHASPGGDWVVLTEKQRHRPGDLVVLLTRTSDPLAEIVKIGQWGSGDPQLRRPPQAALVDGRAVFLRQDLSAPTSQAQAARRSDPILIRQ